MKTDGKEKLLLVTTRKEAKSELERIREEYGAEYEIIGIAYPRKIRNTEKRRKEFPLSAERKIFPAISRQSG